MRTKLEILKRVAKLREIDKESTEEHLTFKVINELKDENEALIEAKKEELSDKYSGENLERMARSEADLWFKNKK